MLNVNWKFFFGFVSIAVFLMSTLLFTLHLKLPDVSMLDNAEYISPLRVYTIDRDLIGEFGDQVFFPADLDEIPSLLQNAFLVTEDQRFYSHSGIDWIGLIRAFKSLWLTGEKYQGASTITMQVARNFFLTSKKTYLRKLQEIILAYKIDHRLPKSAIMSLYLNKIYFGHKAYGIKAAAYIYYGKTLADLTLAEMAVLAGLPKAPSRNNPIDNPVETTYRRDYILSRLQEFKYITPEEYNIALLEPVQARRHGPDITVEAPYVAEIVRQRLFDLYGNEAYKKGFHVFTTVKSELQRNIQSQLVFDLLKFPDLYGVDAQGDNYVDRFGHNESSWMLQLLKEKAFSLFLPAVILDDRPMVQIILPDRQLVLIDQVDDLPSHIMPGQLIYLQKKPEGRFAYVTIPDIEVASVMLAPQTGAILALVGGFDFGRSQYNRVTQARRQIGSLIKPFIYASALDNGYNLASIINDSPLMTDGQSAWRPKNAGVRFLGPVRLRWALLSSLNLATIRLVDEVGLDVVRDYVSRFGFDIQDLPDYLSFSLGSNVATPLELASSYAIFANGGMKVKPYLIDHVEDEYGVTLDSLLSDREVANQRVINETTAFMINDVLLDSTKRGVAKKVAQLGRSDLAGKTGSTNKDVWFCGYNSDVVSLLWLGYDDHRSLNYFASELALPLWISSFHAVEHLVYTSPPNKPPGIMSVRINDASGLLTDGHDPEGVFEYFRAEDAIKHGSQTDLFDEISDDFVANALS